MPCISLFFFFVENWGLFSKTEPETVFSIFITLTAPSLNMFIIISGLPFSLLQFSIALSRRFEIIFETSTIFLSKSTSSAIQACVIMLFSYALVSLVFIIASITSLFVLK